MLRETLSQTDLLVWPVFAFGLFLATFVFISARVLLRGKKDARSQAMALLPLSEDAEIRR